MSAKNPALISVAELAAHIHQVDMVVVDCRFSLADTALGEQQYRDSHIPSAQYFHLDRDMSGPKHRHGGRHPLPDPHQFSEHLRAIGVNSDSLVVCYDDQRFAFASRLWWLMRWLGHDNVRVLDGGFKAWQAAGLPIETSINQVNLGNFMAKDIRRNVVEYSDLPNLQILSHQSLIDSREAPRYRGEQEPIDPLAGHIPGAINMPWAEVTTVDGFALDERTQRQRWGEIAGQNDIIVYCGSGVTACVNLLSLAIIGRDDAKLYAGSWSDWCSYVL